MGLLNKKIIVPERLNGLYQATVLSYTDVENREGGYTKITFKVTENRNFDYIIFPSDSDGLRDSNGNLRITKWVDEAGIEHKGSQYNYVMSSLASQLNVDGELTLTDLLDKAKTEPIGIEFSFNEDVGRMNASFKKIITIENEEAVEL